VEAGWEAGRDVEPGWKAGRDVEAAPGLDVEAAPSLDVEAGCGDSITGADTGGAKGEVRVSRSALDTSAESAPNTSTRAS